MICDNTRAHSADQGGDIGPTLRKADNTIVHQELGTSQESRNRALPPGGVSVLTWDCLYLRVRLVNCPRNLGIPERLARIAQRQKRGAAVRPDGGLGGVVP